MRRDDGALLAIALVAVGAGVGHALRPRAFGPTPGSGSRGVTGDLIVGNTYALVLSRLIPYIATLVGMPVPGARVMAAVVALTPLLYMLGKSKIKRFLSLDRDGQVRMIRRHSILLMGMPPVGVGVVALLRSDEKARKISAELDRFLRETGDQSPEELERSLLAIADQYAAVKAVGSRSVSTQARRGVSAGLAQLQSLLGHLHGLRWLYHASHWTVMGPSFYGDHLLFERLYDGDPSLDAEIDSLGEKIVGAFGRSAIDAAALQQVAGEALASAMSSGSTPVARGLWMERKVQQLISSALTELDRVDQLSIGLDDFLMGLASERETAIYLLSQREGSDVE